MLTALIVATVVTVAVPNLVIAGSIVLPIIVGLITKSSASSALKAIVLLGLTIVGATITTLIDADGTFELEATIKSVVVAYVIAVAGYYGLLKPTGIAGAVQEKTADFGLG